MTGTIKPYTKYLPCQHLTVLFKPKKEAPNTLVLNIFKEDLSEWLRFKKPQVTAHSDEDVELGNTPPLLVGVKIV